MDSGHEMLLYVYFVVFLSFIQVSLKLVESQGVALLVGTEVLSFILEALVGQVDLVILSGHRVVI